MLARAEPAYCAPMRAGNRKRLDDLLSGQRFRWGKHPASGGVRLPGSSQISHRKGARVDAKYNRLTDRVAVRLTLNTVALAIWIAVSVGLLELAVKV